MSTATCNERLATKSKQVQFPISKTLSFFGQVFSKDGTRPDPRRLADFLNVSQPNSAHKVRSFLGMANCCSKYVRDCNHSST